MCDKIYIMGKNKSVVTKIGIKSDGDEVDKKLIGQNFEKLIEMGTIIEKVIIIPVEKINTPIIEKIDDVIIEKTNEPLKTKKPYTKKIITGAVKNESP